MCAQRAQSRRPLTYECAACEKRKPLKGFHRLAGKRVAVCASCYRHVKGDLEALRAPINRLSANIIRLMFGLRRASLLSGEHVPSARLVEIVDGLTTPGSERAHQTGTLVGTSADCA